VKDVSSPAVGSDGILVIEDDRALREGVAMNLRAQGYEVITAVDGDEGMDLAFSSRPDLIILDIMLPGWSGLDILSELRKRGSATPVLILSARSKTPDKVEGLKRGADDYLAKPFDLAELLARVEAMLRRRHTEEARLPPLTIGDVAIDRAARRVRIGTRAVQLSAREFDLLCLLAATPGQVFTRETILERVWGWDYEGTARTVDNFVARLRKKLGTRRRPWPPLQTIPRVGYMITP
jgi:DNA-binding response OmpR family regulator